MSRFAAPSVRLTGRHFALFMLVLTVGFSAMLLSSHQEAHATCGPPSSCLPGSGYTFDDVYCGVNLNPGTYCSDHSTHSWGFNSADGNTGVAVCGLVENATSGADAFAGCATNVARSCYFDNCNDQSGDTNLAAYVQNNSSALHTVNGHAEA